MEKQKIYGANAKSFPDEIITDQKEKNENQSSQFKTHQESAGNEKVQQGLPNSMQSIMPLLSNMMPGMGNNPLISNLLKGGTSGNPAEMLTSMLSQMPKQTQKKEVVKATSIKSDPIDMAQSKSVSDYYSNNKS